MMYEGFSESPSKATNPNGYSSRVIRGVDELETMCQSHESFLRGIAKGKRLNLAYQSLSGISFHGKNLKAAEFKGANLTNCDFTGANLEGCSFYCANLEGATLTGANLRKCDLRGARLDRADLRQACMDQADCRKGQLLLQDSKGNLINVFRYVKESPVSFCNANLVQTSLCGALAGSARFVNANIDETNFEGANLSGADFANATIKSCRFNGANLMNADFSEADLVDIDPLRVEFVQAKMVNELKVLGDKLQNDIDEHQLWVDTLTMHGKRLILNRVDLRGLKVEGANWSAVEFINVNMSGLDLSNAKLAMASFTGCNFNHAILKGVDARGVNMNGSSFLGASLSGGNFSPVENIRKAKNKWAANFNYCNFTGAAMVECDFTEAIFGGAVLNKADLTGSNLNYCDFSGSKLCYARFSDAKVKGIITSRADLHGVNGLNL